MSARLEDIAADVAWGRPAVIPAALILNYSGPAFAGVDWINAWDRPYLLGFESSTIRAYSGDVGGPVDAEQWLSVAATIPGYLERRRGFWFCAADEPNTPAWALGPIRDYGASFTARLVAELGPLPGLAYGNRDAATAGTEGINAAGGIGRPWGVGTWGYGESGGGNPPDDSDAALVQSGNNAGPAEGTDLNWMFTDLADLAAHGGPDATPIKPKELPEMFIGLKKRANTADDYDAAWIDGGVIIRWFGGDPAPYGYLRVVGDAINFANGKDGLVVEALSKGEWDPIEKRTVASQVVPGTVAVDIPSLATELANKLPAQVLDAGKVADAVADRLAARLAS